MHRIAYAKKALTGVSTGDAFGESFFGETQNILSHIAMRKVPDTTWEFTDDTVMSIAVFNELKLNGDIDQDSLVQRFCTYHNLDVNRGYGATFRRVLREIQEGSPWQEVSAGVFDGQGSMGNGAAMRVCPIGAYYYDNIEKVKDLAAKSAAVTHANTEAIAGAIAIATGTALTTKMGMENRLLTPDAFIDAILNELPDCDTKAKIAKSKSLPYTYRIETVTSVLGNGINMTAQDTVPFALWCTAHNLDNFEEALWKAVSALGDRDTICAMVAGMVIMSSKPENIKWTNLVEKVDGSIFEKNTQ